MVRRGMRMLRWERRGRSDEGMVRWRIGRARTYFSHAEGLVHVIARTGTGLQTSVK